MSYHSALRSKESIERAFLLLINKTPRPVDVYWINYASKLIRYATIESDGRISINTYSTHPWIFKDSETGALMHVNNQEVFWPEPWILTKLTSRSQITIHFPLRTLQTAALWTIAMCLSTPDSIEQLEIPRVLANDLKDIYQIYSQYKTER